MLGGSSRFVLVLPGLVIACADTYCQSGPKYGTQCYGASQLPAAGNTSRPGDGALFRQGPPSSGSAWKPRFSLSAPAASAPAPAPKSTAAPLSFGAGLKRPPASSTEAPDAGSAAKTAPPVKDVP